MRDRYLDVTYRKGQPMAAYLHLSRRVGVKASRSEQPTDGIVVDYATDDTPIGIEITAPGSVTVEQINDVLRDLGLDSIDGSDLAPLRAA